MSQTLSFLYFEVTFKGELMDISLLILVVIAILLGALVRNIFGFGEALVTMPLLSSFTKSIIVILLKDH